MKGGVSPVSLFYLLLKVIASFSFFPYMKEGPWMSGEDAMTCVGYCL